MPMLGPTSNRRRQLILQTFKDMMVCPTRSFITDLWKPASKQPSHIVANPELNIPSHGLSWDCLISDHHSPHAHYRELLPRLLDDPYVCMNHCSWRRWTVERWLWQLHWFRHLSLWHSPADLHFTIQNWLYHHQRHEFLSTSLSISELMVLLPNKPISKAFVHRHFTNRVVYDCGRALSHSYVNSFLCSRYPPLQPPRSISKSVSESSTYYPKTFYFFLG